MKSTGSVVTYLIFEFSFQHVLFTRIRVHCVVHILCIKMHYYFLLNIKHGASQLYIWGAQIQLRPRGRSHGGRRGLFEAPGHRRRSSVNFRGARHFCPKKYV